MTNIVIHSEELLRFGGIEYCMSQKNCLSLQDCQVTLSGKPAPLELMIFEKYLSKNKITLKSLKIADGRELYKINGYKVLTESGSIDPHFEENQKILNRINSEENQELWASMVNTFSLFSIKGPVFWKINYEKNKEQLLKAASSSEDISLTQLKLLFEKNCDSGENLGSNLILASEKYLPSDFIDNSQKLISSLKEITKDKRALYSAAGDFSVLLYSTKLFHPGQEKLFFIQVKNGIEFLAPDLNLYLFFPDSETSLIEAYFEYLKNNFINLTKEYAAFIKGKTLKDRLKEKEKENLNDITYNARNRMLQKIKNTNSHEQLIEKAAKKIKELAAYYNLNLNISKHEESFKLFITSNDNNSNNRSFDLTVQKRILIENYDNTMQMLEKEFKRMAYIIK